MTRVTRWRSPVRRQSPVSRGSPRLWSLTTGATECHKYGAHARERAFRRARFRHDERFARSPDSRADNLAHREPLQQQCHVAVTLARDDRRKLRARLHSPFTADRPIENTAWMRGRLLAVTQTRGARFLLLRFIAGSNILHLFYISLISSALPKEQDSRLHVHHAVP